MNDDDLRLLFKCLREDVDRNTAHRRSAPVDWGTVFLIAFLAIFAVVAGVAGQKRDNRLDALEAAVERLEADR